MLTRLPSFASDKRIKRRAGQRLPSFTPPEHHSIVWHLEEQKDYEDIRILELRVGPHGFSDRLVSLEDFAGTCSIEMVRPNSSGALYCLSLESMLPELLSTSVGIVIDWETIEGTTADEIWNAFQHSLVDETIFRPVYAAYSASFPSIAAFSAWQKSLQVNTKQRNAGRRLYSIKIPVFSIMFSCWYLMQTF